jgi:RNA polymerase sigma-70 factor (ECF subfamily)
MAADDSEARELGSPERADRAAASADPELPSFESVFHEYFDFVWAATRRRGVSTEATDDLVQEIFIVIHSRLHTLRQPESLRSWIYGIVRRTVSAHHRAQQTRDASGASLAIQTELQHPIPPTPLDVTERNGQVRLLWTLLEQLDPAKREVFMLAELDEMTVPEIADALDIPVNTVYSRLRAARLAFEAALARRAARHERGG